MSDETEFKAQTEKFWKELPWHFPDLQHPDIVWLNYGAWMRIVKFRGPNMNGLSIDDRWFEVMRLNSALRRLGRGWVLYVREVWDHATDYMESEFPCTGAALIDAKRRFGFRAGVLMESECWFCLIYQPPADVLQRFTKLMSTSDAYDRGPDFEKELTKFRQTTDAIFAACRYMQMLEPVAGDDLATLLHSTISTKKKQRVKMPGWTVDLRAYLSDTPFTGGYYPSLGKTHHHPETGEVLHSDEEHIRIVSILGYPDAGVEPDIMGCLHRLPFPYERVQRWFPLNKAEANTTLREVWRQYYRHRKGMLDQAIEAFTHRESIKVNHENIKRAQEADELSAELAEGAVVLGYLGTTIIVSDRDPEKALRKALTVQEVLDEANFVTEIEKLNAAEAFIGSRFGCVKHDVNRPGMNSGVMSCAIPLHGINPGPLQNEHLKAPPLVYVRTNGLARRRLTLYDGDVGNRGWIGMTGGGKTFGKNFLQSQGLRYGSAGVTDFGRKGGGYVAALCHRGAVYDPTRGGGGVQPYRYAREDPEFCKNWTIKTLGQKQPERARQPDVENQIWETVKVLGEMPVERRTVNAFIGLCNHEFVKEGLAPFAKGGAYGAKFDGAHQVEINPRWQYFELDVLTKSEDERGPMMSCLMYETNRVLAQDCGPVLIAFDEVWMFGKESGVDDRSQPYIDELEDFIRTVRSKGGLVDLATQSAADLITHKNVILANCGSWLITPGKDVRTQMGQDLLLKIGLEMEHIELLRNAQRKRDYLLIDQYGAEMIDFMADPVSVAICGSGDKKSLIAAQQVLAEYGEEGFLQGWLRYSANKALSLGLKQDAEELFAAARWAVEHEGEMLPLKAMQAAE